MTDQPSLTDEFNIRPEVQIARDDAEESRASHPGIENPIEDYIGEEVEDPFPDTWPEGGEG